MKISEGRKPPTFRSFRYWRARRCKAGENNAMAKITKSVVDYIRTNYRPFVVTQKMLADKFGLSTKHIREILSGRCWRTEGYQRLPQVKLEPAQEEAIIQLWFAGRKLPQRHPDRWSRRKLAQAFHCSEGLITHIVSGKKLSVKKLAEVA